MNLIRRSFALFLIPLLLTGLTCTPASACSLQPASPTAQDAPQKPPRKKSRGRLPMYFSKVVTQQQREDIYEIQARFAAKIDELQTQIDKLIQERDQEVESVLSTEQLAEVKKLRDDAKKRRMARRNKSKTDDAKK